MPSQNYIFIIFFSFINCGFPISTKLDNHTTKALSKFSAESQRRQSFYSEPINDLYTKKYQLNYPHYQYQDRPSQYQKYVKQFPYRPIGPNYYNQPPQYPYELPFGQYQNPDLRQTIMDVLHSIAKNDDLHCVPKILCELTAGTISGRQSSLPININLESLAGFLTAIGGLGSSPLLHFGKAAILGYSSKGNAKSCRTAYPECPSDPDKLIKYLNNHNGGFFRYFNGYTHQDYNQFNQQNIPSYFQQNYYNQRPIHQKNKAERRILHKPITHIVNNIEGNNGIRFPHENSIYLRDSLSPNFQDVYSFRRPGEPLKFPNNIDEHIESGYRKAKVLATKHVSEFERPDPNHKASPMIFPDRTGTGELIVDSKDFDNNFSFQDDDVRIKYNGYQISNTNSINNDFNRFKYGRDIFSFPGS